MITLITEKQLEAKKKSFIFKLFFSFSNFFRLRKIFYLTVESSALLITILQKLEDFEKSKRILT